jgi:hypothetical protein
MPIGEIRTNAEIVLGLQGLWGMEPPRTWWTREERSCLNFHVPGPAPLRPRVGLHDDHENFGLHSGVALFPAVFLLAERAAAADGR